MQVHPCRGGFAEQDAGCAGGCVHQQHIQRLLVPRLALDDKAGVVQPVYPGEVDIGIAAKINLDGSTAGQRVNREADKGVWCARKRVALLRDAGAGGADCRPHRHFHRAFINAGNGDAPIVWRPPIAGAAPHFLLRHKLGNAVADQPAAAAGQRACAAGRKLLHI